MQSAHTVYSEAVQTFQIDRWSTENLGGPVWSSMACRGVTRGARGAQFPGRRITKGGTEKTQKYHKYFLQYSAFSS